MIVLTLLQPLPTDWDEANIKPRESFGHILPSLYALLDSDDQEPAEPAHPAEPQAEPVTIEDDNLVPIEDAASGDASFTDGSPWSGDDDSLTDSCGSDASCSGGSGSDGSWSDDDAPSDAESLLNDELDAAEVEPAQPAQPAERIVPLADVSLSIDDIIRHIVKTKFTSYMNAVRILVDTIGDHAVFDILMRPSTSLLSMCQIADTGRNAQWLATRAFYNKHADGLDAGEELNAWDDKQIARLFELFGALMVRLDVTEANRPDLVLGHILARCVNLVELHCAITTDTDIDRARPFFSCLRRLDITDFSSGLEDYRLLSANASTESLTIKNCTSLRLPPVRLPALASLDVWCVYEPHLQRLRDSMVPFVAFNSQLKGYRPGSKCSSFRLRRSTTATDAMVSDTTASDTTSPFWHYEPIHSPMSLWNRPNDGDDEMPLFCY